MGTSSEEPQVYEHIKGIGFRPVPDTEQRLDVLYRFHSNTSINPYVLVRVL